MAFVTREHLITFAAAVVDNVTRLFVKKELGKGLSSNDYTAEDKEKLDGIAEGATAYVLPLAASQTRGGAKTGYTANGRNYPVQLDREQMYVNVPWTDTDTTYGPATASAAGLMSAEDKGKLDNLPGDYIASGSQTEESVEDGGANVYTFEMSDGTTSAFTVRNGSRGSKGDKGEAGEKGSKGDKGDAGAKGEKGDSGQDGVSVISVEQTAASDADGGINIVTVTLSNGETSEFRFKNGSRGSAGAPGSKGDTGAQGIQGPKGDKGATGATGPQGPKGDKGDTGAAGPQGPKGDTGAAGKNATTTAVATANSNGLMGKEMVTKLDSAAQGKGLTFSVVNGILTVTY